MARQSRQPRQDRKPGAARKGRPALQRRSRLLANRIILAVLVVVALAALDGLAGLVKPLVLARASQAGQQAKLDVTSAMIGCPAPGSAGTTGGGIAIANVPSGVGAGQASLTELNQGKPGTHVGTVPRPGQLTVEKVKAAPPVPRKRVVTEKMAGGRVPTGPARGGLIVAARGDNAQGLDVEQLGPGGQPTARCEPAGSDFWFLSPGSAKLHISLYLMNTDNEPADAAVSIQTDSGPLLGDQDSGIVVPPHSMIVQQIDKLVHAAKAIALHVTTSTGRVVAAVRDSESAKKEGMWLPAAHAPSTTQYLAGLPSVPGARELYITVPGTAAAQVKVTAITPRGSYQPTGGSSIPMLGHLTTGIALPSLSGFPGAIKVTSNVPVTASLEVPGGPIGSPGSFVVGSEPITGQGVVAASPAGKVGRAELVLAAPGRSASVSVAQAIPGSALTASNGQVVHIPAKSAVEVKVTVPKREKKVSLIAIVVTPLRGSGPVFAGRVAVIDGSVQTVQPVIASPAEIRLTKVRESLLSILGS
ncbi:MAG TPA: DUF5719 family protein [Streptosporangiaceae bacterium]|nr:DUF5719 family protein [Streptosporangiaceae bacterium]